jgi:hypothetical protein
MTAPIDPTFGRWAAGIHERRLMGPIPPKVYRDPCPRCGTRGDLDCGHGIVRLLVKVQ